MLEVMGQVPRHRFVDPSRRGEAYLPRAVTIAEGQTISQPYMVALMTEQLELQGSERVLEIGTGSGYQAAVLAHLVSAPVVTVERLPRLARTASRILEETVPRRCHVIVADGSSRLPLRGPFDRIVVTAAAPDVPRALLEVLADPGLLVCPVGDPLLQTLIRVRRQGGEDRAERSCACRFVPLVGEGGW
ncbi:MAG: protein-L-isoaspartate(D-aspartate) O-methyltransferase [Gammaproteobacteria bacterium]